MRSNFRSTCSFGIVSFFVVFLASSAPHRVHHIFEDLTHSREKVIGHDTHNRDSAAVGRHSSSDHSHAGSSEHEDHKRKPSMPDCVAASVAQNSHLSIVEVSEIALRVAEFCGQSTPPVLSFVSFNPAPFTERAPPLV
jgi:hypothetical protein